MAESVYVLSMALSLLCTVLLFRGYRQSRSKLLLWSSIAFAWLALNNLILFLDIVVFPEVDFGGGILRNLSAAMGGGFLLYGLIWEVA